MMNSLQSFDFAPGLPLRTISDAGAQWFVLLDICDALGIRTDNAIRSLDADEKSVTAVEGFARGAIIVSESGLYSLLLRSRKPAAKAFKRWVTGTVLPTLRQDGLYVTGQERALPPDITEGELLARMEAIQGRLDALKATKLAEFRARSIEYREDRSVALKTFKRIQATTRSARRASTR